MRSYAPPARARRRGKIIFRELSAHIAKQRIGGVRELRNTMRQPLALDVFLEKTSAARALALELVTRMDLLRLKVIARLHARGLPPEIDWSDLLQEASKRMRRALLREGLRGPQP
jgi:hypothetical protein